MSRRVVVVGGGISGLAAAWELSATPARADPPEIVVLEGSQRIGGMLRSEVFAGRVVDMGADGFLGRRPEAIELCREVGLGDKLVPIGARGASVWSRGRLRVLPEGHAMGIPTRFWPTARSGILGLGGSMALARDALLPRPDVRGPIGDRAVGPLVARRLGRRVVDRLADPLIGGIHAGSVDDMSAAAVFPPLLAAAHRRGSLMRALRAETPEPDPDGAPLFWAIEGGMAALVDAVAAALERRGVKLDVSSRVDGLERSGNAWTLTGARDVRADAVVLALAAPVAARLLRPHDDEAAALLASIDYASVT
ncbi:MAG TPA: protoporphyrinogen oxidase, partial [Acidimicrobiales bacterium]|nr:protoporphyrinogen oxidase [Acidimicrobiales bacterium]